MVKAAIFAFAVSAAFGEVIGFTDATTGAAAWAASVGANGGIINTDINFENHPVGQLQADFYSGIGVTMAGTGAYTVIDNGAGPGQANIFAGPKSTGEGVHAASHYLGLDEVQDFTYEPEAGTFTVSFATPVLGVGLFTIDLYSPVTTYYNTVTISAFDGINGTGNLIATYKNARFNFQGNNLYFMGIVSTDSNIRSLVFTNQGLPGSSDLVGLDNIEFAVEAPEPGSMALAGSLFVIGAFACLRKRFS